MKTRRHILLMFFMVMLWILFESGTALAQERSFVGKVIGIRMRLWLDVQSQTDQAVMNFRIGRRTVYIPRRYPNLGETVKVEYQIQKGVPVAYTVTIEGGKESPTGDSKETLEEGPEDSKEGRK